MSTLPFTSRSAIETYQRCPRKRYLEYHHLGTGVRPAKPNVHLLMGGAVHAGVETLLRAQKGGKFVRLEEAIDATSDYYHHGLEAWTSDGYEPTDEDAQEYREHAYLGEALVASWFYRELPRLQPFKVLEVEQDIQYPLTPDITLESRADAILMDTRTGDVLVYSLKTVSNFDYNREQSYKYDLQGLTEMLAVDYWLKQARGPQSKEYVIGFLQANFGPKAEAVIKAIQAQVPDLPEKASAVKFCFLCKGERRKDYNTGLYRTESFLLRPWRKHTPMGMEWAWSYYIPKAVNKSGKGIIGREFEQVYVGDEMPAERWVTLLESGQIQPECGDPLAKTVITPMEYFRNPWELEDTLAQIRSQETIVEDSLMELDYFEPGVDMRAKMNQHFPQYRSSCFQYGKCSHFDLCYNPATYENPLAAGYVPRKAHHPGEEALQQGGEE